MHVLTIDYHAPNAADLFCRSLKETGFAVIRRHPVTPGLISEFYQTWQQFFDSKDKFNYTYQKPSQAGYFPFRTEKAKNHRVHDLKEFYHFYLWANHPPEINQITKQLYTELVMLAGHLLQWIEKGLPDSVAAKLTLPLIDMITESKNTVLRILHYPPLAESLDQDAVRAAPHEDINLITLIPAATSPGLEVKDKSGDWYEVNCDKGNIIVNVGDMLQECTDSYYQSTTHRVINPLDHLNLPRYSAPLFLHPREEVQLSNQYTAKAYLIERLRQIGIY
ncbi:MAG: isopenicillin N synthase family oxygenase [Gammaproteobacteria bacterium]|nr:isopenicillin N synthase family oxygenase [Gammaproteobacteria bacterium]